MGRCVLSVSIRLGILSLAAWAFLPGAARAESGEGAFIEGEVVSISATRIVLMEKGGAHVELDRRRASRVAEGSEGLESPYAKRLVDAEMGERIRVWYCPEPALPSEDGMPAKEMPGQAAPREKKQILLDDRSFYDARFKQTLARTGEA